MATSDWITAPPKVVPGPRDAWGHLDAIKAAASKGMDLELELEDGSMRSPASLLAEVERELGHMTAEQLSARLLRMERSILRQERLGIEILSALKKIVIASRPPEPERKPRSDAVPK